MAVDSNNKDNGYNDDDVGEGDVTQPLVHLVSGYNSDDSDDMTMAMTTMVIMLQKKTSTNL